MPLSASFGTLASWVMLALWTISSTPGTSPLLMAALASASWAAETPVRAVAVSPGSGVAAAGPAISSVASRPAAAVAAPRRLRRTGLMRNEITASSHASERS